MISTSGVIASYLINSVWEVSLIAGAGWLVSRALRKLGPQAEHITWVTTLLLAMATPALQLLRPWMSQAAKPFATASTSSFARIAIDAAPAEIVKLPKLSGIAIILLFTAYGLTLLYSSARLLWLVRRTSMLRDDAFPASLTPEQEAAWNRVKQSLSLSTISLQCSTRLSGPAVLEWREPMLLVPESFLVNCTSRDLLAALAHEFAHVKRHDFGKNLLYEFLSLPLAFHPLIWVIKSQIAQTREMVCDNMATETLLDRKHYTDSLLRLAAMVFTASRMPISNAIGIFDANILEKRVRMMRTTKKTFGLATKYGLIVPAILLLVGFAAGEAAVAVTVEPKASGQEAASGSSTQVYKIGGDVKAPSVVYARDPEFPESQRRPGSTLKGNVELGLVVDEKGVPHDVRVVRSLSPDFDAKAIEAVQQYRFKPAMRLGQPVAVSLYLDVNFDRF